MSQVITKLQKGGSLTIDGIKYDATPEFINALTTHLRDTAGTDAQTLAGLSNALQNGQDLRYDSAANTISGMDGIWSGITDKQNERRKTGSSNWKKWWEAQFDTDAHRFRNALSAIGSFHYQVPKAAEETPANLRDISSDKQWFEFTKGEDGKEKWNDSVFNSSLFQRIDDVTSWLKDPEAGKKAYRLGSGYTDAYMQAFQNLYKQNETDWDARIQGIKDRLKTGTYDDADLAFLKNFFIAKPDATTEETEATALAADKKRFADAGFDYDKWSPYITWNSDKNHWNVSGAGQEAFRSAFGGNGNYWFNDNFIGSQYNPTGALDFLNGYFVIGDRLYKQSDAEDPTSELSQILRRKGGFRDLNAGMRHNEANALIEQLWGTPVEWEAPNGEYYSDWLDPNGNIYYRSRTGDYNWTGKDGNQQLVEWIAANPELADAFGYYTPQFKLTDKYGNELNKMGPDAISGLTQLSDSQKYSSPFNRNKLWFSESGNSDFDGRYFLGDGVDEEGNVTGAGFWINPNDPTGDWIFESDEMSRFVPDLEGNAVRIPKEMAAILSQNPDFIKNFQNDTSGFRSKFAKVMAGAVGRGINFSTFMANAGPQAWMNLGFDANTARKLAQISRNYSQNQRLPLGLFLTPIKSNRGKRRAERMAFKPTLHKDGGRIEKAAYGEMMGKSSGSSATPTQTKTDKPIKDTGEFTNFGDKLQPHDYVELAAVAADAGSIISAFTGNPLLSGLTGIGGSTLGFAADIKRDGFQMSDLGQYGLNLGFDALSFIPFAGAASQSKKLLQILSNSAKSIDKIMKGAALYGISHATVQSWDAIKNGNFNMRDLRAVVNAVGGVAHLGLSGFRKPVKGKAEITYPTINLKAGKEGNPIKLTESQFNAIQKANPKTKEELAEQLGKIVNKTKEQVIDDYDLDDIIKHRDHRFGLFGKEVNKVNLKADKSKGEIKWEDVSKNQDKIKTHEAYLANLAGRQPVQRTVTTPERTVVEYGAPMGHWEPKYKTIGGKRATSKTYTLPDGTKQKVTYPGIKGKRIIINEADKALPVPLQRIEKKIPGETITYNDIPRLITPITSGITWERPTDPLQSPAEVIPIQRSANPSRNYQWKSTVQPVFRKKGGKIEKGQFGLNTDKLKLNLDILDPNKVKSQGFIPKIDPMYKAPSGSIPTFVPNQPKELSPELQNFKVVNPMTKQLAVDTRTKQSELIQNPEDDLQGTFSAKKWDPDLNVPLNWARSLYAMKQSDKQLKNFLNRPQYQASDLLLNAPRYINTGTGNAYRNQANQLRLFKPVTSDAMQNDLMARDRQREALNAELQGNLADSQEYGQYKAGLDDFNRDYTQKKYNIAEQNKQLRWQHEIENVQAKNANIAEKSKFFDQAAYATQDWWNRNYQMLQGFEGSKAYTQKLKDMDDWYRQERLVIDKKNLDDNALAQELASLNARLALKKQELSYDNLYWNMSPWFREKANKNINIAKSGGKISSDGKRSAVTYSRDPYPELLLQNAKDSTEIVKQLNDAVIKLLLQTKPINVH